MRRSGFGANALYVNGRIFAMLSSRNQLVFKLPADRVRALTSLRVGARFDAGRGRLMREWLVLRKTSWQQAQALALEAFEFVRTTQ
ncbi:MAG TPA: hypothetical protein VFS47_05260 [Steroidobacteraceae bacterium]|nr:hypothetical protein [Steroidobacteraceae bacterium]